MTGPLKTLQSRGNPRPGITAKTVRRLGPWFHNLHLPDGTQTAPDHPLGDFPRFKWEQIAPHLPEDIAGWRVLDIGCNAGFYSFELAGDESNWWIPNKAACEALLRSAGLAVESRPDDSTYICKPGKSLAQTAVARQTLADVRGIPPRRPV